MKSINGWVKIHRSLRDWEWYDDSKMVHLFIHLILSANHADGRWRDVKLRRGQLVVGRNKLASSTGISEQSIRSRLDKLKSTGEIIIEPTNRFSVITIVNYDYYQGEDKSSTSESASTKPAIIQPLTTNKKNKNENKDKTNDYDIRQGSKKNRTEDRAENSSSLPAVFRGAELDSLIKRLPKGEAELCRVVADRGCDIEVSFQLEMAKLKMLYPDKDLVVVANKIRKWNKKVTTKNAINLISGFLDRTYCVEKMTSKINKLKFKTYGKVRIDEVCETSGGDSEAENKRRIAKTMADIDKRVTDKFERWD